MLKNLYISDLRIIFGVLLIHPLKHPVMKKIAILVTAKQTIVVAIIISVAVLLISFVLPYVPDTYK